MAEIRREWDGNTGVRSGAGSGALAAAVAALGEQIRPGTLAAQRTVALAEGVSGLFPGGLPQGSTVCLDGPAAVSLALALAAGPTRGGGWAMVIGLPFVGLTAAFEQGVVLERLVLVAHPPPRLWPDVVAAAGDGSAVVIAAPPASLRAADARRVQARLARSGTLLITLPDPGAAGSAPGMGDGWQPDIRITTHQPAWAGLLGPGAGRLLARTVEVEVAGRRAVRSRRCRLQAPGPTGESGPEPVRGVIREPGREYGSERSAGGVGEQGDPAYPAYPQAG